MENQYLVTQWHSIDLKTLVGCYALITEQREWRDFEVIECQLLVCCLMALSHIIRNVTYTTSVWLLTKSCTHLEADALTFSTCMVNPLSMVWSSGCSLMLNLVTFPMHQCTLERTNSWSWITRFRRTGSSECDQACPRGQKCYHGQPFHELFPCQRIEETKLDFARYNKVA